MGNRTASLGMTLLLYVIGMGAIGRSSEEGLLQDMVQLREQIHKTATGKDSDENIEQLRSAIQKSYALQFIAAHAALTEVLVSRNAFARAKTLLSNELLFRRFALKHEELVQVKEIETLAIALVVPSSTADPEEEDDPIFAPVRDPQVRKSLLLGLLDLLSPQRRTEVLTAILERGCSDMLVPVLDFMKQDCELWWKKVWTAAIHDPNRAALYPRMSRNPALAVYWDFLSAKPDELYRETETILDGNVESERVAVIQLLAAGRSDRGLDLLRSRLAKPVYPNRKEILEAISQAESMRQFAEDVFAIGLHEADDADLRSRSLYFLPFIEDQVAARRVILRALSAPEIAVLSAAIYVVGEEWNDTSDLQALFDLYSEASNRTHGNAEETFHIRAQILTAIGEISRKQVINCIDPRVVLLAIAGLEDPDMQLRIDAIRLSAIFPRSTFTCIVSQIATVVADKNWDLAWIARSTMTQQCEDYENARSSVWNSDRCQSWVRQRMTAASALLDKAILSEEVIERCLGAIATGGVIEADAVAVELSNYSPLSIFKLRKRLVSIDDAQTRAIVQKVVSEMEQKLRYALDGFSMILSGAHRERPDAPDTSLRKVRAFLPKEAAGAATARDLLTWWISNREFLSWSGDSGTLQVNDKAKSEGKCVDPVSGKQIEDSRPPQEEHNR